MENLKISNIPIYRAKKIDSDEWVIGYYQTETGTNVEDKNNMFRTLRHIIIDLDKHQLRLDLFGDKKLHDDSHIREQYEIDPTTLAIHFPDILDSQGNKIFASLSEDGKGGDIVISKSYPFYGDAPEITDSNGKCEELNYKGLLLSTSTGCYINYIKVSDRVKGCAIGCAIEDFNEFKSIGIQE